MLLGKLVRLVMIQFSFSNPKNVPGSVRWVEDEPDWERVTRKTRAPGTQFIAPTMNASILNFIYDLELAGYELVDAFTMVRRKADGSPYDMVRFVFARHEYATPSEVFMNIRDCLLGDLIRMCAEAMWRVRAYDNPYGESERSVAVCMEARTPLLRPDGQPVTARLKDEQGRPYGDPVPLVPKFNLRVEDGEIKLVKV